MGRPMTSLRPAVVMSFLSRRVEMTPEVLTPRISEISGAVTGCLYAMTARVSRAGMERRAKRLDEATNGVVVLGLGVHLVATSDGTDLDAAFVRGVAGDEFVERV